MGEVSFENLFKVMGFTYVFQNGEKCHALLRSCFVLCFCVFGKVLIENELFVGEVSFENLLNVIGFAYVFETGQKCCVLLFPCFFVFFVCVVAKLSEKKFDGV